MAKQKQLSTRAPATTALSIDTAGRNSPAADGDLDGSSELAALASFNLPASPVRSPVGSESNMSVWVEETTDGEQRVHVALADASVPPLASSVAGSAAPTHITSNSSSSSSGAGGSSSSSAVAAPSSATSAFDTSLSTGTHSSEMLDFPLVLCDSNGSGLDRHGGGGGGGGGGARTSSAIVPFQKLQMDTNLNQTLLPYKSASDSGAASPASSSSSPSSSSSRAKAKSLAWEAETSAIMSNEFMHALRFGELRSQEPQLSVRLRGSRVELASASEEEDVDFMGPAENIKKLFKLPYSQARVSLAVHRVGNTLVVDGELQDSDLPAGFEDFPQETMTIQQSDDTTQSLLYEKFIYESTVQGRLTAQAGDHGDGQDRLTAEATETPMQRQQQQHKATVKSKKSQKKAKKKAAHKAAAPYALTASEELPRGGDADAGYAIPDESWIGGAMADMNAHSTDNVDSSATATTTTPTMHHSASPAKTKQPQQKKPTSSSASYSSPSDQRSAASHQPYTQAFQRVLKWKFHDLKMILGSQVLLFSNKEHPAVSLKLHDMDTDLSLCTVLDYYLDNVIANIPELAICMHSKGLVRGYKLVETRQIPYMSGTGRPLFDIQDVSMNASMLLKFLQENCSRPNGTYWLYRKEGENSLRLYDVNVLSQGKQLKWKYMMAMLCYRFASRASRLVYSLASDTPRLQRQLQQRQRELLSTCMKLLNEISQAGGSAHSSICSSVSEQLADTYLRECEQVKSDSKSQSGSASFTKSGDDDEDGGDELRTIVDSLQKAKEYLLESIRSFEECMAVPGDADPASASSLPQEDLVSGDAGTDLQEEDDGEEMDSFMEEERTRLRLKFSSACLQLGQVHAKSESWEAAVASILDSCQFLPLSAIPSDVAPFSASTSVKNNQIHDLLEKLDFDGISGARQGESGGMFICSKASELRCRMLEVIGDVAAQLPAEIAQVLQALYGIVSGERRELLVEITDPARRSHWTQQLQQQQQKEGVDPADAAPNRWEELLTVSFNAYLRALSPCIDSELYFLLMKKLGNASNELGKFFLGSQRDYVEAFRWFERGCKIFSEIEDGINVALLYANLAHLHKILAQGKPSPQARLDHYQSAIQLCNDALQQLKQNKAEPELHRKVKGELALTYLVWAVNMANDFFNDRAAPSRDNGELYAAKLRDVRKQRENQVHKTFNKALSLYAELEDLKQVASTHYQMASFHNRTIARELQDENELAAKDCSGGDVLASEKSSTSSVTTAAALKSRMEIARRHYEKALTYFGKVEVGKTFVLIHQELADLYAIGGRLEDIEHALLIMLNTYDAFSNSHQKQQQQQHGEEREEMLLLAGEVVAKVKLILHQLIRLSSSAASASGASSSRGKKLQMFKGMYKEVIYYDGHKAGSIVPMLGTLRSMYLL